MKHQSEYGGLLCSVWNPPPMETLPLQEELEHWPKAEKSRPLAAVADAEGLEDIVMQFNRLLSGLRVSGLMEEYPQAEGEVL